MIPWERQTMAGNSRRPLGIFCHYLISKTVITLLFILIASAHARPLNFTFSHRPRTHPNSGQPNSTSGNTNSSMVVRVIVSSSSSSFSSSSSSAESIFPFPRLTTTTVAPDTASTSTQIRPTTYRPQVPYFRHPDNIFSAFYRAFSQEGDPSVRVHGYPAMRPFHRDTRFGELSSRSSFPSNQFLGSNTRISNSNISLLNQRTQFPDSTARNQLSSSNTRTSDSIARNSDLNTRFSDSDNPVEPNTRNSYSNNQFSDSNARISDSIPRSSNPSTQISETIPQDPKILLSGSNTRFPDSSTRLEPNNRSSFSNTQFSDPNTRISDPKTQREPNYRSSFPTNQFSESNTRISDSITRSSDTSTPVSDSSTLISDSILEIPNTRFADSNTRFSDYDPAMSDSRHVETFQMYNPTGRTSEVQAKAVTVVSQSRSVSRAQPNPSTQKSLAEDHHYRHNAYSSRERMHAISPETLEAQNQKIFKLPRPEPLTQANPNEFGRISTTHDVKPISSTQSPVIQWEQPERVWGEPEKVWGQPEQSWGKPEQRHDTQQSPIYESPKIPATTLPSEEYVMETEVSKFYELGEDEEDEPKELVINKNAMDTTIESAHLAARSWELPEVVSSPKIQSPSFETMTAESIQVPQKKGPNPNANAHFHQVMVAKEKAASVESSSEAPGKKFGYVLDGSDARKYRVEERTPDGYIVGEYGVINHDNGFLRGVRYTADGTINPRLIHEALMKFLSL